MIKLSAWIGTDSLPTSWKLSLLPRVPLPLKMTELLQARHTVSPQEMRLTTEKNILVAKTPEPSVQLLIGRHAGLFS